MLDLRETPGDLLALAAEILGVAPHLVPPHWVYHHRERKIAHAVTVKNAIVALQNYQAVGVEALTYRPWHAGFFGRPREMIAMLISDGLLGPQIGN